MPLFAQGQPNTRSSLKRIPPNLSQRVIGSKGTPLTTKAKVLTQKRPLNFSLGDLGAFDQPTPEQSASVLKRMNDLEAVILAARVPVDGRSPSSEKVIAALRSARDGAAEQLKKDLSNLLIAGLVETTTQLLDDTGNVEPLKTTTWGYRSLDEELDWGPTIEFAPNSVQLIPVLNLLDQVELTNATVPDFAIVDPVKTGPDPSLPDNGPHGFDVINLHTHGLNVSPRWPADDIFRRIGPGQLKFFVYQIPPEQPAGTYFYHPHNHGSVADQVAGGMAGPLIVRDNTRGLDAAGEKKGWGKATESIVMFQQLTLYKIDANASDRFTRPDFFALKDMDLDRAVGVTDRPDVREVALRLNPPAGPPIKRLDAVETWVSGAFQPTLGSPFSPGEVRRLRLIHAGVEENVNFTIEPPTPDLPRPLIQVIAWDGIPLAEPFIITERRQLLLSPGNRADVLVVFPTQGLTETLNGESHRYAIVQRDAEATPANALAYLAVQPGTPFKGVGELLTPRDAGAIFAACAPKAPDEIAGDVEGFDLSFADATLDPIAGKPQQFTFTPGIFQINRRPFPGDQKYFRIGEGRNLSFSILQGEGLHPLHIHVNSFLVEADDSRGLLGLPTGKFWADTLLVRPKTPANVAMPFANWTGVSVAHCHILDHEDAGMMNMIHIRPEVLAWPEYPLHGAFDRGWLTRHQLDQVKPVWPQGNGRVVSHQPDMATLFVFMPAEEDGSACPHCTEAVKLVAQLRKLTCEKQSLRIVAVSAASVDKLPSVSSLGLLEGSDQLCSDPELRAFEAFSLLDGTPHINTDGEVSFPGVFREGTRVPLMAHDVMHGLFITGPNGRLVSIRRGFVASDDAEQILREAELARRGNEAILRAFDAQPAAGRDSASHRHRRSIYESRESLFQSR
ncbi:MAG: multicopper oxidase domain-containing protein [Planctomycetia bacterium]